MTVYLPHFELIVYLIIYIAALGYALYEAYLFGNKISDGTHYYGFQKGWSFLNRRHDELDYEWGTFVSHTTKYAFWLVCHILLTEIIRFVVPKRIPLSHAIIGICFVCLNYDQHVIILTSIMIGSYLIAMLRSRRCIWSVTLFWLILMNFLKKPDIQVLLFSDMNPLDIYEVIVYLCWMILRLVSFSLDYCNATSNAICTNTDTITTKQKYSFVNFLGYILYMPTTLHGPPFIYERYASMFEKNKYQCVENFLNRLKELLWNLLQIGIWYFFNELAMHYFYVNNIIYDPQTLRHLNIWAFYAFAICAGCFFSNKYRIAYGLGYAIGKFDRIDAPEPPIYVLRIHLYSNLWRNFDRGLHEFLFRYIYKALCHRTSSLLRKLFASFITFSFIYFWHGYYEFILIWAILNFICLHLENVFGKFIAESAGYRRQLQSIGKNNIYRLNAIFGSQLLMLSVHAGIFFLGGKEMGMEYATQTYLAKGFKNYFGLTLVCYCWYTICEFSFRWEAEKKRTELKIN